MNFSVKYISISFFIQKTIAWYITECRIIQKQISYKSRLHLKYIEVIIAYIYIGLESAIKIYVAKVNLTENIL